MKKLLTLALVLALFVPSAAWAANTLAITVDRGTPGIVVVGYAWVADTDGSFSASNAAHPFPGPAWCFMGVTDPGSTAPTDDYDLTLSDADGADIFGAELNNRDASNSEQVTPKIGNTYGARFVKGQTVTLAITNNSVNSATGTLRVYCWE